MHKSIPGALWRLTLLYSCAAFSLATLAADDPVQSNPRVSDHSPAQMIYRKGVDDVYEYIDGQFRLTATKWRVAMPESAKASTLPRQAAPSGIVQPNSTRKAVDF